MKFGLEDAANVLGNGDTTCKQEIKKQYKRVACILFSNQYLIYLKPYLFSIYISLSWNTKPNRTMKSEKLNWKPHFGIWREIRH